MQLLPLINSACLVVNNIYSLNYHCWVEINISYKTKHPSIIDLAFINAITESLSYLSVVAGCTFALHHIKKSTEHFKLASK